MPAAVTGIGAVIAFVVVAGLAGKATHNPYAAFLSGAAAFVFIIWAAFRIQQGREGADTQAAETEPY